MEPPAVAQPKASWLPELNGATFDFIIVGGGTAGCLIAFRLATALPHCSVLLVEAGGEVDQDDLVPGYTKGRFGSPQGNWMYETVPQKALKNRVIPYPRGKGLGGSSGNNFMGWVRGPDVDYDDWAKRTGDDWWKWDNVLGYLKRLEDFRAAIPPGGEIYAKPTPSAHTSGGLFPIGYGPQWQDTIPHFMSACTERGHSINLDNNDGDMLGVGIGQFNVGDGARASSATVFLNPLSRKSLKNLTVATGLMVSRLLSKDHRITALEILSAIPNELDEPITIHAAKETILTAGCFHSPQLLLLSGIGPAADLKSLGIPVVQHLPAVGQNLQDHSAFACEFIVKPSIFGHNQLLNDAALLQKAAEDYRSTQSGPLAMFGASAAILFPKLQRIISSKEVASLPQEQQTFLTASRRPSTEIWMHSGPYFYTGPCPPDASVLVLEGLCQNTLSRGSMRLRSSNPRDLPIVDPNYMSHPYDMRVATETLREMIHLANTTALSSIIESILFAPRARSDESRLASPSGEDDDLLEEFIRETLTQGFHAMSTCVMGKKEDSNKVVGTDFRVNRIDKLRIADMSVCPILTTNHTQVNAYLIGERCAEFLIEEYSCLKGRTSTKLRGLATFSAL